MNDNIGHTCSNCLNAYQNDHVICVRCCNKDFDAQFAPGQECSVEANESCGRWSRRRQDQPELDFRKTIQLSLFNSVEK